MKKKTFGRVAALGLAGLTVLPAYSMVASAEAYPTYVYEFTYGGIASTQIYYSAIRATSDNAYVKFADQSAAQTVFDPADNGTGPDIGFVVNGLNDNFWKKIDDAYKASKGITTGYACTNKPLSGTNSWQYAQASAFSSDVTPVVPKETYEVRLGSKTLKNTYAFKTKAERDAAMNDIIAKNKNEYTTKYNAANSALAKDLSAAIAAYQTAQRDLISKVQAEANKYFKSENANANTAPVILNIETFMGNVSVDIGTLDLTNVDTEVWQKEDTDPKTSTTLTEWVNQQNAYVNEQVKELNKIATQVKQEFAEAYKPANWAFGYDSASDGFDTTDKATPFVSNYGAVSITSTGSYISDGATYGITTDDPSVPTPTTTLSLHTDYYRTVGAYVSPESYAFKGEILPTGNRTSSNSAEIASLLLDSDCWSLFSVLTEGSPSDNSNTTEGGKTEDKKEEDTTDTTPDQTAVYKVGDYYYPTYSAAYNAAGGNEDIIKLMSDYVTVPYDYFSQVTGTFYKTYDDALKASNNSSSKVTVFNGASTSTNTSTNLDPYYYYILNQQNGTKDTTSATLGKKTGWTSIANYLNKAGSGTSVTVNMNKETTVPSSVLAAIEGKNITVNFRQSNGASLTVNGKDIADTKNVEIDVTYNTKNVSKKLIQNAFKKNGAVSSAQISIDEGSFGFDSDLTVKFNSKRAGYSAKIYRYNASRNSLQLVDTATVSNSGKTTFNNITKGGEFVIVLFED